MASLESNDCSEVKVVTPTCENSWKIEQGILRIDRSKLSFRSLPQQTVLKLCDLPPRPTTSKMTYDQFNNFIGVRSDNLYLVYNYGRETIPLDDWLAYARPSRLSIEDNGIGWIAVTSPSLGKNSSIRDIVDESDDEEEAEDEEKKDGKEEEETKTCNKEELLADWNKFLATNQPLTNSFIRELASKYNKVTGKWLIHAKPGIKIDLLWRRIVINIMEKALGDFAISAMVNTVCSLDDKNHVIMVWNNDCTSIENTFALENALRNAGIRSQMQYKPDVFTLLKLFPKNPWNFRPCTYISSYDARLHKSTIESVYDD